MAAWQSYVATRDRNALEDEMLRILEREANKVAHDLQASIINDLIDWGKLPEAVGEQILMSLPREHKVVEAAFDAFADNGDVDDLVDTLVRVCNCGSNENTPAAPRQPPSPGSSFSPEYPDVSLHRLHPIAGMHSAHDDIT